MLVVFACLKEQPVGWLDCAQCHEADVKREKTMM